MNQKRKYFIYLMVLLLLGAFLYFFVEPQYGPQVELVKNSQTKSDKDK